VFPDSESADVEYFAFRLFGSPLRQWQAFFFVSLKMEVNNLLLTASLPKRGPTLLSPFRFSYSQTGGRQI
jgi:hypothetical protein